MFIILNETDNSLRGKLHEAMGLTLYLLKDSMCSEDLLLFPAVKDSDYLYFLKKTDRRDIEGRAGQSHLCGQIILLVPT